ncbi:Cna B-type domain-containing protein, partial [Vagococcus fluvialis]
KTSVTVTKAWNDSENQDGIRPTSIQVQLYADGKAKGDPVTLTKANTWTHTWQELDEKASGKEIVYTVKEVGNVPGYTVSVNGQNVGNIIITNSHTPKPINKPTISGKPSSGNSSNDNGYFPKTGEMKNTIITVIGLAILGITVLLMVAIYRKKFRG